MPRYFFEISYNGQGFSGWQRQINTKNTIQEHIEERLSRIIGRNLGVIGCGRTDKGVHAKSFYFHVDTVIDDIHMVLYKLNRMSGPNISFKRIFLVDEKTHARFSARERSYEFYFHKGKNVFLNEYSHGLEKMPDLDRIQKALRLLPEYKDYRAFCKSPDKHKSTLCNIRKFPECIALGKDRFYVRIKSNRFLRGMIRILMHRIIEVGQRQMSIEEFERFLIDKEPEPNVKMLPPDGLFLADLVYDFSATTS